MSEQLTCRQLIEFLLAYVEGELEASRRRVFDEHLSLCPQCMVYVETYVESVRLGKQAFACDDDELPDDVPERLVQAVLEARRRDGTC